ncbi:MAG: LamG domain-containing protein [Phycisphaerae bacterium]
MKLNGVKVLYDGDADNLTRTAWQQWNIDLKDFTGVNLSNVTELSIGLERSGVAGGKGAFYFDDIWLYPPRCIPSLLKPAADFDDNCTVNYLDLEIMAGDWLLNDYTIATAVPNPAGLIGHWPFDGNLNDISGNGRNGNPSGSPLYVAGHIGQAISLNGATQGVAVSGFSQIQGVSEVTIAMWAKTDVVTGTHTMWFTDQADGYGRTRCRVNNGNWQWIYGQAATSENIQITSPATAGVWTHFTGVRSNNNKLELFIDGVSKGTQPFAEPGPHSDQSSIGGERRSPTDIRDRFDGLIDDVRVYKYALSAAEAAYLADESPGDGQLYVPVQSVADLYNAEPVYYRGINFKDYAVLVDGWLDKQLWPAE